MAGTVAPKEVDFVFTVFIFILKDFGDALRRVPAVLLKAPAQRRGIGLREDDLENPAALVGEGGQVNNIASALAETAGLAADSAERRQKDQSLDRLAGYRLHVAFVRDELERAAGVHGEDAVLAIRELGEH